MAKSRRQKKPAPLPVRKGPRELTVNEEKTLSSSEQAWNNMRFTLDQMRGQLSCFPIRRANANTLSDRIEEFQHSLAAYQEANIYMKQTVNDLPVSSSDHEYDEVPVDEDP
jgi:hypothetical protein